MDELSPGNEEILRLFIIAASFIGAVLTTVLSIMQDKAEIFPFLYVVPIVLLAFFYPRRGIFYTLAISLVYLLLVLFFGNPEPAGRTITVAWFAIFIIIGIVTSVLTRRVGREEGSEGA